MLSRRLLRIKVVKALFAHLKSGADNMIASEKTLMTSVDKAYDLYFQILILPVEIARYAEQRQELAKQKKLPTHEDLNPNTKFVDNQIIRVIANSDAVNDYAAARKLNWTRYPELIRTLYTQLTESDYFKDYMARPERSFADDRKLLEDFFKELQSCEPLDNVLEEMSILWSDDLPYIVMMILRSLSNLRPTHTELKVPAKFKSDEDPQFVRTLFEKSLVNYDSYQDYIEKFTSNWDVERIVFMDNLIIGTAMAELTSFPSIPVKVTLDEYIEISKYYSTPGSSTFINGVLDKIVDSLTAEGRIKKAGRGLRSDAACLSVAASGRVARGMRRPAGEDRTQRPDYHPHGQDSRHGRYGHRAFRTPAFGRNRPAASVAGQRDKRTGRHRQIRPQLRMHDARI
jgi:N utilization substance protein B